MPGQKGHPAADHLADQDRLTRLPERGLDLDLVAVGKELVEARTPDDPDVRDGSHRRQATFSPEELADEAFSPPEDGDEEEDDGDDGDEEDGDDESDEDPAADEEDDACAGADDPFRLSVR
jgi:hypothetical protein